MASRRIQILVVGAHPADTFDQAGGTLAHHAAQGDKITVATLTTGARSHHFKLVDEKKRRQERFDVEQVMARAVEEKLEETRRACRVLGFDDVRTLGFEDDEILLTKDMVEKIADLIRDVRPDLLITHHPFEMAGLKMHGTTGQAVIYAFQQAMGTGRGTKKSHSVTSIYFMNPMGYVGHNTLGYAGGSSVSIYVDITDVVDKKVKAMDAISTQHYGGAYSRKCQEIGDGFWGNFGQVAYAEPFQALFPRVAYTLPISDAEIHRSTETTDTYLARRSEIVAALMPMPPGHEFTSKYRFTREMYDV